MSYSIKEIVDIAVGIEEAGIAFYTGCAEKFKEGNLVEIFTFLAGQEQEHKEKFESLREKEVTEEGIFSDDYFSYMKSIGGSRVFGKEKTSREIIDTINDEVAAVRHAFNDERESILFYTEMKKLYSPEDSVQELIDSIIEEERRHVMTLMDLLEKITISR